MAEKRIIAVVGATGAQGGGLVRAILNDKDGDFAVRAITRDANSEKAKALTALGADVVAADLDNAESVQQAFKGAYGAFCVTFFWNHFSPDKEISHAKTMAEAAKRADVKHVIWSTLEDTRKWIPLSDNRMPTLMGKYKVPHLDAKSEADRFFVDAGVSTTFLLASFYWDNMILFGMGPKRGEDGELVFALPLGAKKISGIAAEDIGKCAYGIFKGGSSVYAGRYVGVAGEHLTGEEMAAGMTQALGEEVRYHAVPADVYRSFGFPGADDLGNMFQFFQDNEQVFLSARDLGASRNLNPSLQTFSEWLEQHKTKLL